MRGYNNAKLTVQIDMEFRRPFGENTDDLVGEIARLVTLCASFDVPYWRDVPEDRKTKIYEKLLDKFELKVGDEAMSERNKVNRSKQVISHITGRRSFKQVSWAEEAVKDKLEELASQPCDSPIASTPEEVLSLLVGQRSGYVRGRGCGPRPPSKSVVTTATIAGLEAQVKDKDERISQMEELISKQREEVAQIQEKLFKQKEEVTAEVTVEVTARLQSDMSSQLNELVNKKFMDMMFQFHRDLGPGH
ncbi:hypothetical protein Taro_009822 [Colocasia esculenta]|uniref:Transposase n=1 Tax=Colocasia esculenta TaxID=4460 RepID=A0A843U1K6_COLES|nr:hypothetical protein [Colocasia esculenta]